MDAQAILAAVKSRLAQAKATTASTAGGSSLGSATATLLSAAASLPSTAGTTAGLAGATSSSAAGNGSLTQQQATLLANHAIAYQISQNPLLANSLLQQRLQAAQVAQAQQVDPDVQELADHFGLDERITKRLDDEMKNRQETFEGDIAALWDILETARSPAGLLSVKIKEMQDGTFIGAPKLDKEIKEFQRKFRLDDQATRKLAEVRVMRAATWKDDIELIHKHLETSNKPSARIMMMLGKLRSGEPIGEPDPRVAPGSWADRKEQEKERAKRDKKSRSRDRGRARSRSRDRRKSRSRDRDRRR
mmetsp:Transcript_9550/g.24948  ORF Transcript_9550/g.24948 Transcript_9550/m.24948 type:complete len:305 (-) Transcript_9550:106-1020(-)